MRSTCPTCLRVVESDGYCPMCEGFTASKTPSLTASRAPAVITTVPEPHDIVLADLADAAADARRQYKLISGYLRTAKVSLGAGAVIAGAGGVLYNVGIGAVLYLGGLLMVASFIAIMVIFAELTPERLHREWREAETKYAQKHRRPE